MAAVMLRSRRYLDRFDRPRPRRQPSALGIVLVAAGLLMALNLFVPGFARTLWGVFAFWPLLLIVAGVLVFFHTPSWLRQLDLSAPPIGAAIRRPQRLFAVSLVVLGIVLLPFTLHLADERILGAVLLIGLGALLIWRRAR